MNEQKVIMCEYIGLTILMANKLGLEDISDRLQEIIDDVDL